MKEFINYNSRATENVTAVDYYRLQAQGTPAHPYRYTSAWDVARKTYAADGVRGFYKGLGPTLFKVVPSISISYAVYEFSKRSLGIS